MASLRIVPVIGLVGGVGSGKSSIAKHLGKQRPIVVIDGDAAGHLVLEISQVKHQIRQTFGDAVFDREGKVDRGRLGQLVFGDATANKEALKQLEQIVHPEIREELRRQIEQHRQAGEIDAIFLDAAVLLEAGWNDLCNSIVYVDSPLAARQQRVRESRNWDDDKLQRRESSQWPLEQKRECSDFTIDNSSSLDDAARQLSEVLDNVIQSQN